MRHASFFRFAAWVGLALFASTASAEGILDTVNQAFSTSANGWMGKALEYAKTLFFGLAALEFAWSAIHLTLRKSELSELAVSTLFKVMSIAFFAMVLVKAPEWIPAVMDSFKQAGAGISNGQVLSPSNVITKGINLAGDLVDKGMQVNGDENGGLLNAVKSGGTSLGSWMLAAVVIGLSGILVMLAYAIVAIQLFVALVESYLVIGGGALMLGFLGSRWTMNYGEKYFGYAVSVGIKLFTLYLVVGFGDTLATALTNNIMQLTANGQEVTMGDWLGVGGASLVFGGVGYMVPGLAASMMNGAPSMSMSNLGAAAGGVAAAPVAAGLGAGATVMQGAGLATGAAAALMRGRQAIGGIGGAPGGGPVGGIGGGFPGGAGGAGFRPGPGGAHGMPSQDAGKLALADATGGKGAEAGARMGQGQQKAGAGQADGFAGAPGGGQPRVYDEYIGNRPKDVYAGDHQRVETFQQRFSDENAPKSRGKLDNAASWMKNKAQEMQYQSDRRKPHLVHDGNGGGVPSMRLNID